MPGERSCVNVRTSYVPSGFARHSTAGSLVVADFEMTTISSLTRKHDRMPTPNWPMKSVGRSPSATRFELSPIVARKRWTSSSVEADAVVRGDQRRRPALRRVQFEIDRAGEVRLHLLAGPNRVDAVLQQLADEHLRPAVEVLRQQVDNAAQMDLELVAHDFPGRMNDG